MTAYIAVAWGLFFFSIITLLFSSIGLNTDTVSRRISGVLNTAKKLDLLDEDLDKPLLERFVMPIIRDLSAKLQKWKPGKKKNGAKNAKNEKLYKMIRQSGMSISTGEYSLVRFLVILCAMALSGGISLFLGHGVKSLLAVLFGAYAGFAIMRFQLTSKISGRRHSMEQQMPDVLDLLSINVEAGLGFMQALLHVIDHYEGPLIDELTITYREMTMGRTRREALSLFADRCDLSEIKTFVGSIVQAEQLGISIKNVLRTQAAAMRTSRRNKVEEKAMKISVKILLPMVLFIFPVLFIVLMGPAAVKIMNQFKG